jgi:hypothetical protein
MDMTKVYVKCEGSRKRQEVEEMTCYFVGEEFVWFEFVTVEGQAIQSLYLKGVV